MILYRKSINVFLNCITASCSLKHHLIYASYHDAMLFYKIAATIFPIVQTKNIFTKETEVYI